MIDVITAPTPETATEDPAVATIPSPIRDPQSLGWWTWLILLATLLVGVGTGLVVSSATRTDTPVGPDLEATLDWMFTASLTYAATTDDGLSIPPPAEGVEIREVEILDPVRGPILAIVELDHGGSSEVVAYEVTTWREGRAWSVGATPLGEPGVTRPES